MKLEWESCRGFSGIKEYRIMTLPNVKIFKEKCSYTDIDLQFGEIEGKHSDIYNTLDSNDFKLITDNETIIKFLQNHPNGSYIPEGNSFIEIISEQWKDYEWEDATGLTHKNFEKLFDY